MTDTVKVNAEALRNVLQYMHETEADHFNEVAEIDPATSHEHIYNEVLSLDEQLTGGTRENGRVEVARDDLEAVIDYLAHEEDDFYSNPDFDDNGGNHVYRSMVVLKANLDPAAVLEKMHLYELAAKEGDDMRDSRMVSVLKDSLAQAGASGLIQKGYNTTPNDNPNRYAPLEKDGLEKGFDRYHDLVLWKDALLEVVSDEQLEEADQIYEAEKYLIGCKNGTRKPDEAADLTLFGLEHIVRRMNLTLNGSGDEPTQERLAEFVSKLVAISTSADKNPMRFFAKSEGAKL